MNSTPFLDSREKVAELDTQNVLGSIEQIGQQVQHVWQLAQSVTFEPSYASVKNIVVAGMGGSVLGTHVIQTLFKDQLKVPVVIAPDYEVPQFVNQDTLVVASSFSGTTEETLAATRDAIQKGAQVTGLTSGGPLAELLHLHQLPVLEFDPIYNPSQAPRMGLGYSLFGQIALMSRAGLLTVTPEEYQSIMTTIASAQLQSTIDASQDKNPAKILAYKLYQRVPVVVVAEHLEGMAHVFANQLNENAKTFSEYRVIPELNHHLMEGLRFPEANEQLLCFVTVHSDEYSSSNTHRLDLTEELFDNHNLEYLSIKLHSASKLAQNFELLVLAAYTSFYLAMLNNQNPFPIPQVDWFKSELKKKD